jgi:hypothetical protein
MRWCWCMQCWCNSGWSVYCNSGLCNDADGNGCSVDAMVFEVLTVLWQKWFNGVDALIILWQQFAEIDANKFYWHHHQKFKFSKIWIYATKSNHLFMLMSRKISQPTKLATKFFLHALSCKMMPTKLTPKFCARVEYTRWAVKWCQQNWHQNFVHAWSSQMIQTERYQQHKIDTKILCTRGVVKWFKLKDTNSLNRKA